MKKLRINEDNNKNEAQEDGDLDFALASRKFRVQQEQAERDQAAAAALQQKEDEINEEASYQRRQQQERGARRDAELAKQLLLKEEQAIAQRQQSESQDAKLAQKLASMHVGESDESKKKRELEDARLAKELARKLADEEKQKSTVDRDAKIAAELAQQELLQLQKKKSVHQQDEELARTLQEQERQAALQRAMKNKQSPPTQTKRISSGPIPTGTPVNHGMPVMAQPVMGQVQPQPMNISVTLSSQGVMPQGLPPGVKVVKAPKGVILPPGCVLGSDDCVYDQSNGFRAVGKLKKNEKKSK